MFLCAVTLLFSICVVQAYDTYIIPEPDIVIYEPRGFSVSIPHKPGIRLFAFHGSVNQELKNLQPGQFSKDIGRSSNDKWIYHERRAKLKIGDTIHYWLFVVKNGLGYRLDNGQFVVKELIVNPFLQPNSAKNKHPYAATTNGFNVQDNEVNVEKDNTLCLQSIFNVTQTLIHLQTQYEEIKKKNVVMKELIEKMPNARQLTISGRIPPDGLPSSTVSFILREKLSLNPSIASARRNSDGSITFEVTSLEDKLKIIDVSKEKLLVTKIFIE